jgi:hypothetical protein
LVSLPTEDGGLYHIVADVFFTLEDGTQIVYFYGEQSIVATESNGASVSDKIITSSSSATSKSSPTFLAIKFIFLVSKSLALN